MSDKKRVRVIYTGRVQGVGMRATIRQLAEGFIVTGNVKNLSDGTVQLEAQGTEDELERFLAAVAQNMSTNIQHTQRNTAGFLEGEFGFSIEYR